MVLPFSVKNIIILYDFGEFLPAFRGIKYRQIKEDDWPPFPLII
jgi:hypothetical protein